MYPGLSHDEIIEECIKELNHYFEVGPEVALISAEKGVQCVPFDESPQKKFPYFEGTYEVFDVPHTDFQIRYGRMIEIYMAVSLAPIPMATWGNHEQSHVGQNYLRSLFALGFQGFLILICVAIYAVLLQNVAISGDAINSIWSIVGYTVLLCFSLFKTSSVAKTLLGAH